VVRKRQVFGIKYVIVVKYYSHLDDNRDYFIYICIWLLFGDRTIVFFHEKIMRFDRSAFYLTGCFYHPPLKIFIVVVGIDFCK
jgi:hypothetical protein